MRTRKRKRERERRRRRVLFGCYAVLVLVCCFYLYTQITSGKSGAGRDYPEGLLPMQMDAGELVVQSGQEMGDGGGEDLAWTESAEAGIIDLEGLYSAYAILLDAETGQVLAEKNCEDRIYPASMTKLMAALTAVEHTENWDTTVVIPQEIFGKLMLEHASMAGFEPGEQVTPEALLYGMLLPSGAECCTAYAMWLAGDEETFVSWMNETAMQLGMTSTHFTNTTGLHDTDHYSTAADMAVLLCQCLQNETLRTILSSERYQTTPTPQHPEGLAMESTLFQAIGQYGNPSEMPDRGEFSKITLLGGKTGYTSQAGLCLASFARIEGREYILVTAGAEGSHYTEPYHVEDALNVYGMIVRAVK